MCIGGLVSATMGAMNKRELAKAVAVQSDVELKTVITVLDGFTDVVTAVVAKGEEPVSIPGFAKFVKVDRPARMGRNPATGETIRIKASKKARITPVKAFKDAVLAPSKAPKLVKGAYPTVDAAVAAAGKATAPAAAKAPAKKVTAARKAPAKKATTAAEGPGQEGHDRQTHDQEVARSAPSRMRDGASTPRVAWTNRATAWPAGGRRRTPSRWPIDPSVDRTVIACRQTIRPTRRSSGPTTRLFARERTPISTLNRGWSSSPPCISPAAASAARRDAGTARTSRESRQATGLPRMLLLARHARNGHGHGMSDTSQGPGWWLASDGKWYPPELWTGPPTAGPAAVQSIPPANPAQAPAYPAYPAYGSTGANPSQGYGYGQPLPYGVLATRKKTNGLAIASLVCSCAGIFLIGIPAVLGIIFGFVARSQIRRSQGTQGGDGLALAGIIVGFAVVALLVVAFVVAASNNTNGVVQALDAVNVPG